MTDSVEEAAQSPAEPEPISFAEFLEGVPPSQNVNVSDLAESKFFTAGYRWCLSQPQLQLHCTSQPCNGLRFFRYVGTEIPFTGKDQSFVRTFMNYRCANCQETSKTFSIQAIRGDEGSGKGFKFGELPPYGPPTPARLIRLFGTERETFLKGRRSENQGLGIGAFSYYRRVVERQKNEILAEIIRVSEKLGTPPEAINLLKAAQTENQFSKAVDSVRDAIPQALLICGRPARCKRFLKKIGT